MAKIIGITGSFGTGKTTVSKMFIKYGAVVLNADKMAHQALKLKAADRKKLAKKVFSDRKRLNKLCQIIHPVVVRKIKKEVKKHKDKKLIIIDAPLLIEVNLLGLIDKLVVVKTSRKNQLIRTIKKRKFTAAQIQQRIKAQMSLKQKMRYADFIVDNNGSKKSTERQVKEIWLKIKKGG